MRPRTQSRQPRRVFRHVIDRYYQGHIGFGHDQDANAEIVRILWMKTECGRKNFRCRISAEESLWLRVMMNSRDAERRLEEKLEDIGSDKHVSLIQGKSRGKRFLEISFYAKPASC